jgi:NTE family protein
MIAFVLSGGGSLGAIQAGMLEALLERDVVPDALVGTSIGAANAAFLAAEPTLPRAQALSDLWRSVKPRQIFPLGPIRTLNALRRDGSLFPTAPLRRLIERHSPYSRIERARIPLRIVATDFEDGTEVVFDSGPVADAVLASTALPGLFPPHRVSGRLYLDGGLVDQVPLAPATAMGADTIYVLSCGFPCPPHADHRSARSVLAYSMEILLSQRVRVEVQQVPENNPGLKIVSLPPVCSHTGLRDLGRVASLIERARSQTRLFLAGQPCDTCTHEGSRRSDHAPVEEVVRLSADLSIA